MNKAFQEELTNSLFLETKGITALIYVNVMRLDEAYHKGITKEQQERLLEFKQYKDLLFRQIEGRNFDIFEKLSIYREMYRICLMVLKHNNEFYRIAPQITKQIQHYIVRILEKMEELEEELKSYDDVVRGINDKQEAIEKLKKMSYERWYDKTAIRAIINECGEQLKRLEKRNNEH